MVDDCYCDKASKGHFKRREAQDGEYTATSFGFEDDDGDCDHQHYHYADGDDDNNEDDTRKGKIISQQFSRSFSLVQTCCG